MTSTDTSNEVVIRATGTGGNASAHIRKIIEARAARAQPIIAALSEELTDLYQAKLLSACEEHLDLTDERVGYPNPLSMIDQLKVSVDFNASSQTYAIRFGYYPNFPPDRADVPEGVEQFIEAALKTLGMDFPSDRDRREYNARAKEQSVERHSAFVSTLGKDLHLRETSFTSKHLDKLIEHLNDPCALDGQIDASKYVRGVEIK